VGTLSKAHDGNVFCLELMIDVAMSAEGMNECNKHLVMSRNQHVLEVHPRIPGLLLRVHNNTKP